MDVTIGVYFDEGFLLLPELSLLNRLRIHAATAVLIDYRRTIFSPELQPLDSPMLQQQRLSFHRPFVQLRDRAHLPPRISFIIRNATTPFASAASITKEVSIRRVGLARFERGNPVQCATPSVFYRAVVPTEAIYRRVDQYLNAGMGAALTRTPLAVIVSAPTCTT